MSFKGLNYGKLSFSEESPLMTLSHGHKPILNLNYERMNNSTINKNDIIIEHTAEDLGNEDIMCEIRLHVEEPKD